jgi:hypothetical protein
VLSEDGRLWLEKKVDPARHLHRRFDAWGVDAELLRSLEAQEVFGVRCVLNTGEVEEAPLSAFCNHGIPFDFGHGPQVFLPRRWWRRRDMQQGALFAAEIG